MHHRVSAAGVALVMLTAGLLIGGLAGSAAAYQHRDWGHTWSMDHTLKPRCHDYRYRYNLDPPQGQWALETFLVDPDGEKIAHGGFLKGIDPKKGVGTWRICKPNTRPGKFTIKGKITVRHGETEKKGWIKPFHFTMSAS